MSEVLRAIMDHNCVDSRTAFYSAQIVTAVPNTGVTTQGIRRVTVPCKADTWFLCQGATEDSGGVVVPAPYVWDAKAEARVYQIRRGNTGEAYSNAPQQQTLLNYNLNNFASFDEYILFEPSELILIDLEVRLTSAVAAFTGYAFVTLMGIEYQMPARFRGPRHG